MRPKGRPEGESIRSASARRVVHDRRHRQGLAAQGGHPLPRAGAGRRAAGADRRRRLPTRRGDPAGGGALPPRGVRRGPRRARRARCDVRGAAGRRRAARRARVQLLLAPRQHRRGRAPEPAPSRARAVGLRATARQPCARARPARGERRRPRGCPRLAGAGDGEPGAHRASDRGQAQAHPGRRARDRERAERPRPHGAHR